MNREAADDIKTIARVAAKNDTGLSLLLSPDLTEEGRYAQIVSEYRRAFGVAFTVANANLKLFRKDFIGRTENDARYKAEQSKLRRQNQRGRERGQPSWHVTTDVHQQAIRSWSRFSNNRMMAW